MDDSDPNLNGTFTETSLNSTFTSQRAKTSKQNRLAKEKEKNLQLASLHERAQVMLIKLEKQEDRYVNSEIANIGQRISEFGRHDYAFYRVQSREMLLQMLETAEAVEAKMYEVLEELRDAILRRFNEKSSDRQHSGQEQ